MSKYYYTLLNACLFIVASLLTLAQFIHAGMTDLDVATAHNYFIIGGRNIFLKH